MTPQLRIRQLLIVACCALIWAVAPAAAQETADPTTLDPRDLAVRYLGFEGMYPLPDVPETYAIGDTLTFNVPKSTADAPTEVTAQLVGRGGSVYLWVEQGIGLQLDPTSGEQFAAALSSLFYTLRLYDNYNPPINLGGDGVQNPLDVMSVPDVDLDERIHIVYTRDLTEDRDAIINPFDSVPWEASPGGYSNAREVIYVNTTLYDNVPLDDGLYFNLLSKAYYDQVMGYNNPALAPWLVDALHVALSRRGGAAPLSTDDVRAFLDVPNTSLLTQPSFTDRAAVSGGQQLFINYLSQRFGAVAVLNLFGANGLGVAPVNAALEIVSAYDSVTGLPVTAADLFADFAVTNAVNALFGDGRYAHTTTSLLQNQRAITTPINALDVELSGQSVAQFGTQYYEFNGGTLGAEVRLTFSGQPTAALLDLPDDHAADDAFYWSGRVPNSDATLTRTFDLSGVESAELTFDVWHDLVDAYSYGYVSVSTDDGATWTALPATTTTTRNRHGVAYGAGFTGVSNPEPPRPFPIMGVLIAADGVTITDVSPGGAAQEAGVRAGDVMIGYEGQEWESAPNVIGMLADYAPGDTLNLLVERGSRQLEFPIVLGAHPTRIVEPSPLWQPQTVDLTPYVGQEIRLRFEYISLPGRDEQGIAIDNIMIEAIDYADDASQPTDWTMRGWTQTTNQVPQPWYVHAITTGTQIDPPRVRPLITPSSDSPDGEWSFTLARSESLIVVVNAVTDSTSQPGIFTIAFE